MPMAGQDALSLLLDIEQRSLALDRQLPSQEEVKVPWSGVGFRIGEQRAVAELGQVTEVVPYPELTRVPGAVAWVKGVANVRGTLLPVSDLRGFLGRPQRRADKRTRVLVVSHAGNYVGLVVDEVLGLQHFTRDQFREGVPEHTDRDLSPFVRGGFQRADEVWPVVDFHALTDDSAFRRVSQ